MAKIDIMQQLKSMTTRQKAIAGVTALVVIIIIWQISSLFGGGGSTHVPPPVTKPVMSATAPSGAAAPNGAQATNAPPVSPDQMRPQPVQLMEKQAGMSQREMELLKLQQETQAKYLSTLNDLQMLRVER